MRLSAYTISDSPVHLTIKPPVIPSVYSDAGGKPAVRLATDPIGNIALIMRGLKGLEKELQQEC
jgi:hypothetical protein